MREKNHDVAVLRGVAREQCVKQNDCQRDDAEGDAGAERNFSKFQLYESQNGFQRNCVVSRTHINLVLFLMLL